VRVVCLLFHDGKPLNELAEACYRLTPRIALRENEALFLEIDQCQRLYNEHIFMMRLQSLLKRFGRQARVGISDDPAFALAFARTGLNQRRVLPLESLLDIANPFFRDDDVVSQITQFIIMLGKLGLRTFQDFAALPPRTIAPRFRALGLELHHKVAAGIASRAAAPASANPPAGGTASTSSPAGLGAYPGDAAYDSSLWPIFTLPEKIIERTELDYYGNCTHLEPLLFVLKPLLSRMMARLAGRGERLSSFELDLEFEKLSTNKKPKCVWGFDLPLPQGSEHAILPIIRERLSRDLQREPLKTEVVAIEVRVIETSPGQYWQRNFFNRREEEQEAWNSLIVRLCEKLGHEHSFVASPTESYRPEKAWRKIKHEEKHAMKQPAQASLEYATNPNAQSLAYNPVPSNAIVMPAFNGSCAMQLTAEITRRHDASINAMPGSSQHAHIEQIIKAEITPFELPFPQRPLRILKYPQALVKVNNALVIVDQHKGPGKRWEISDWEGPERLSGEWWGEEFERDYFRVGTHTGEQLWIYRIPNSSQIFLHGYFD
jgi:hypothetical protein